ncbi:MAG: adenylyltransferase/cytidyltransferase family protein [Planctomycetota bacterium]
MGDVINDRDELVRRCAGKRVVLTNGCFDLLHVGHLKALRDAKALGDVLVVAVNEDATVRRLKGPGRPLTPVEERAELLAALVHVDFVHPFPEPTVDNVLRALSPAVFAKGTDYIEDLPERETANEIGAEIAFTGGPKVHSVSELLARIRDE